jgi:predicted HTH transcriptional regulator
MKKNNINPLSILFIFLVPVIIFVYLFKVVFKILKKAPVKLPEYDFIPEKEVSPNGLNQRQLEIIEYMRNNKGVGRVSEMVKLFSQTDRTIRRDLNKLEGLGVVKRTGSTKSVSYTLK